MTTQELMEINKFSQYCRDLGLAKLEIMLKKYISQTGLDLEAFRQFMEDTKLNLACVDKIFEYFDITKDGFIGKDEIEYRIFECEFEQE